MKVTTLAQRHENLLKAIHANKDVPQQFSARHLVTRCKGLALKDPANLELKIAIVNCVGASLSIRALGKLLSEVIHGRRYGDYELQGHRTKEGTNYSCWQFTLLYFGAPLVEPAKPEVKLDREERKLFKDPADRQVMLDTKQFIANEEAAEKLAADQQTRLELAETREIREEWKRKNKEQQRALRPHGEPLDDTYERLRDENARAYREIEATKPLKWKLGERAFMRGQWGVYTGTPDNKTWETTDCKPGEAGFLVLSIVETGPADTRPAGDMLRWYEEQSFLAMMRGDDRSMEEIAAASRVWSPRGVGNFIGSAIPIDRGYGNFRSDNESDSDLLDRKLRGYR
jgi:hypothetical protein